MSQRYCILHDAVNYMQPCSHGVKRQVSHMSKTEPPPVTYLPCTVTIVPLCQILRGRTSCLQTMATHDALDRPSRGSWRLSHRSGTSLKAVRLHTMSGWSGCSTLCTLVNEVRPVWDEAQDTLDVRIVPCCTENLWKNK